MEKILLKQALTSKDKIFSVIAHDLKTPLNGIIGFSELMIHEMKKPECMGLCEKNYSYLQILNSSCYKMLELIKNLETWSRLQNGLLVCQPVITDLSKLVNNNIELLDVFAKNKEIRLVSGIHGKVDVFADYHMLNIIIRNLISNALKFTGNDGQVKITSAEKENMVTLCVSDNGTGISPEHLLVLFDKDSFVQNKGTANEEGTGLGLKMCKEFIELNNGEIWVESNEGSGSRFYISVPAKPINEL